MAGRGMVQGAREGAPQRRATATGRASPGPLSLPWTPSVLSKACPFLRRPFFSGAALQQEAEAHRGWRASRGQAA